MLFGGQQRGLVIYIKWSDFPLCHQCQGQSHSCDVTTVHYKGMKPYFQSSTVKELKYNLKYYGTLQMRSALYGTLHVYC